MFELTHHALEQFISRADPGMSHDEARHILHKEGVRGVYLDIPTRTGERYLYMQDIEFALILKRDGAKQVAVTCVAMTKHDADCHIATDFMPKTRSRSPSKHRRRRA